MTHNGSRHKLLADGRANSSTTSLPELTPRLWLGLHELLRAFEYAQSAKRDLWDFAVEIATLRTAGLAESDFRWLVCLGYVQHAPELTRLDEKGRQFLPPGDLLFSKRTCFVFTECGASAARALLRAEGRLAEVVDLEVTLPNRNRRAVRQRPPDASKKVKGRSSGLVPTWDFKRHELRVEGNVVKQFKWPAVNQEMILATFEEEAWPHHVDDPLPPQPEQDPKRRLHDTIKCLNRNQKHRLIYFGGDGTGEGIVWQFIEPG